MTKRQNELEIVEQILEWVFGTAKRQNSVIPML
jgi:hypothetical protein